MLSGLPAGMRFQSTLPRRERLHPRITILSPWNISIHAPAKGATNSRRRFKRFNFDFNPRSREGSDGSYLFYSILFYIFQSTLPRRERHRCECVIDTLQKFQSTLPRRERQTVYSLKRQAYRISIHAPAKGAT